MGGLPLPAHPNSQWDSANPLPNSSFASYRIVNIGRGQPVRLILYISALGKKAIKEWWPAQLGDAPSTWSDTTELKTIYNYNPTTAIQEGINNFVEWYTKFYKKSEHD
jgi:UDP-glucuronate 4-epimerase